MLRHVIAGLLALTAALPARAACSGSNQIDALPEATRSELRALADAAPFAQGNFWQAKRGDQVITLIGTYHLDDPRHDAIMQQVDPFIEAAHLVLVEAGPQEVTELKAALARDPSLMFITDGPTLPESLPPETWEQLKQALSARGMPPFMGAKMRPAYLSMTLGVPPCASGALSGAANGLDQRIMNQAKTDNIPVAALEPFDTVFRIFSGMSDQEQLEMLEMSLAIDDQSEAMFATMTESYFAEDSRMLWELTRWQTLQTPGMDKDRVAREFALMEDRLMVRRNQSWIPVLEAASFGGPVVAAFGALHLSGSEGVLALLERRGFTITRLPL
ncbi:MAG: TraB/GumN family protein [Cereibacter sphaeroides]|uniref:TraB/GumN family protein n=1 Tax=Cereibacter sphaeroides TaxID=1063 RepID=A0A2W5SC95_CERSP|nr:MAG: TraB/GumN family protein [Cereibacter sphaeroides]